MATEKLPSLSSLLFASFRTSSKGVRIGSSDYSLTKTYDNYFIDTKNLKKYNDFFGIKSSFPVTYLFLISMRSQLAVMNDKTFPISVMGLVHLGNTFDMKLKIDVTKPIKIETTVTVPTKEEGSLFPVVKTNFYQNNNLVAEGEGFFIAKRKRKTEKKVDETQEPEPPKKTAIYTEELVYPKNIGWKYAAVSGDYNPIHLSSFFAKNFGFKSSIAHGWNSASRVFAIIEKQTGKELKSIKVNFKTPIALPDKVKLELYNEPDGSTGYKVINQKDEMCLEGTVG
jgi:acyl dehydratase